MNDYKWVEEIPTNQFSNKALVLVSQFSHKLNRISGRHLNMQDPKLAYNLVREIKLSNNAELHTLFNALLEEFHKAIELKSTPSSRGRVLSSIMSRRNASENIQTTKYK